MPRWESTSHSRRARPGYALLARRQALLAHSASGEDKLRILPILGKGPVQNVIDILYLKSVDIGLVARQTYLSSTKFSTAPILPTGCATS